LPTDREIVRLHLRSMYDLDGRGRIVGIRETDPPPPPRLALFRGADEVTALAAAELQDDLATALLQAAASEPWPALLPRCRSLLAASAPIEREYEGPAFYLPGPCGAGDGAVIVDADNLRQLTAHFPWSAQEFPSREPMVAAMEDGVAVSLCFCARFFGPATPAGVYTAQAYRGRGHATRVVRAWAAEVARRGSIPLYGTTWDNTASRAIAARLDAVEYGSDFWIR
jgi:GNAT superfamily N-acetyltransferase